MREYLVQISALDENLDPVNLLFSGYGYTFADGIFTLHFEQRVVTPLTQNIDMFSSGTTSGMSQIGYGFLELVNTDGGLDYLINYKIVDALFAAAYVDTEVFDPSALVFGYVSNCDFSLDKLTINIKDRSKELDKPILTQTYGGTNILPDGLDGTDDIKGQLKPRVYGKVFNITPVLVNTSKLIYQVSDVEENIIDNVYDKGVNLIQGSNYASLVDLEATAPTAGYYRVYKDSTDGTYFRIGSNPDGAITCDARNNGFLEPSNVYNTLQRVVERIVLSLNPSFSFQGFLGSSAPFQYESGIYLTDSTTAWTAIYEVLDSVFGFVLFSDTAPNDYYLGILEDIGASTPDFYFTRNDIISIERSATSDADKGIASYKQTINYAKNYTIQNDSDLATSVPESRKLVLAKEFLSEDVSDSAILALNSFSPEIVKNTYICNKADALTELGRITDIYSVDRVLFKVELPIVGFDPLPKLSNVVNLQINRFGLDSGKSFRVLGVQYDYPAMKYRLTLWG